MENIAIIVLLILGIILFVLGKNKQKNKIKSIGIILILFAIVVGFSKIFQQI